MTLLPKLTAVALAALGLALAANTAFADRRGDAGQYAGGGAWMAADFAAMDVDKDGKVTPAEIDGFRKARIAAADTDGDGFLNADEMQAMALAQMQKRVTQNAARMLKRNDADGDGKLSLAEMEPRSATERMVARLDTDKDGALSEAELAAAKDGARKDRDGKRGRHGDMHGSKGNGRN